MSEDPGIVSEAAGARVDIPRAFREVATSPILWLVVVLSAASGRLGSVTPTPVALLSFVLMILIGGYTVSLARRVALHETPMAPPLSHIRDFGRRGGGMLLIILVIALPIALVFGIIVAVLAAVLHGVLPSTDLAGRIGLEAFTVFAAALALLTEVTVVSRYVVFDRVTEALRVKDALLRAWEYRGDAVRVLAVMAVSYALSSGMRWSGTNDYLPALIAVQTVNAFLGLVVAHLVGQFCRIAYAGAVAATGPSLLSRLLSPLPYPLSGRAGVEAPGETNSPAVQLCVEGADAEIDGRWEEAQRLYQLGWDAVEDDFDAAVAAHCMARTQATAEGRLTWSREALRRAQVAGAKAADDDGTVAERLTQMYPALYAGLARALELNGDEAESRRYYQLAGDAVAQIEQPEAEQMQRPDGPQAP